MAASPLEVSDDGAGVDLEKVRLRAAAMGLVPADVRLNDAQASALLFRPGFSTADEVTDLAGRGVGMDVVKRSVESLRGHVELRTKSGVGTTVSLRLPETLAIVNGFSFEVAGQPFVLPVEAIHECVHCADNDKSQRFGIAKVHGGPVPYVRLREFWNLTGPSAANESMIIVKQEARQWGLVVDQLMGSGQTVIKPLGRVLSQARGISGSAITGTGRVALIVDLPALAHRIFRERPTFTEGELWET